MPPNTDLRPGLITQLFIIFLIKARGYKWLERFWKPSPGLTTFFDWCIKVTHDGGLAEADTMRFVAQHTSVPVPTVYYAFVHKGRGYLVMSKIRGHSAWRGWIRRSEQSKAKILGQLRQFITDLRSVPAPQGAKVGNIDGGPFYDCRLPSKSLWGPFDTVRDFHEALASGANIDTEYKNLPSGVPELFAFYRQAGDRLVLTHGDLSSLNIMVEGDEVTGIVDWETLNRHCVLPGLTGVIAS